MRKSPIAVAVLAACMTLTACGGDGGSTGADGSSSDPSGGTSTTASFDGKTVCVDQYATATVISDLLDGIRKGLASATAQGLKIQVENPNADTATEQTIAQKFKTGNCSVVVPVGTAAAQLMANAIRDIPIVFAASSTPVEAKLVDSMEKPGRNVTGVADVMDPRTDAGVMTKLIPGLKTVGIIWKNGDPAGDALCHQYEQAFDGLGVKTLTATITTGSEVTQAAQSLVNRGAQAVGGICDTTTISAAGGIIKVADQAKIPVFGGTSSAVDLGGVEAQSYDYKLVGADVATMVLKVLGGADPATTPVVIPDTGGIDLNVTKLKKLGIDAPQSVLDQAVRTL